MKQKQRDKLGIKSFKNNNKEGLNMKKTWDNSMIKITHAAVPAVEYNQLLDEWADIVYRHFCQLSKDQTEVPVTLLKRTGAI